MGTLIKSDHRWTPAKWQSLPPDQIVCRKINDVRFQNQRGVFLYELLKHNDFVDTPHYLIQLNILNPDVCQNRYYISNDSRK